MVKPGYEQPIDVRTYRETIGFFETLMKLLHPFMPFITEEVWHHLETRENDNCITIAEWPSSTEYDQDLLKRVQRVFEIVSQIRHIRFQSQTPPRDKIDLYIKTSGKELYQIYSTIILKLGNLSEIYFCENIPGHPGSTFVVWDDAFLLLTSQKSDPAEDRVQMEKELEYTRGFLASVEKKLNNKRFVDNAPEQVVKNERKKKEDAEAKIKTLEASLSKL
jgi:valyl-tRNA synthetase